MQKDRYERYGDYILDRSEELGKGSYGKVYRGYHLDINQRLTAIAIKEAYLHEQIMKEIRTLETLSHRNIVKYLDYREHKGYVYMFMELCEGSLDTVLLRNPTAEERLDYFRQIVAGVRFMYSRSLLHRDLKPSNILVRGNTIKIADFGTAKFVAMDQLHHETLAGTPLFCSPEMLQVRLGQASRYTEQSEIWSMGLLLYYIFNFAAEAPVEERTRLSLPWHSRGEGRLL
jgi:serine/threonine protein kinase